MYPWNSMKGRDMGGDYQIAKMTSRKDLTPLLTPLLYFIFILKFECHACYVPSLPVLANRSMRRSGTTHIAATRIYKVLEIHGLTNANPIAAR